MKRIEREIADLQSITVESKRIKAQIEEKQKHLADVVALFDSRA